MEKVRMALIGTGTMGKKYAEMITDNEVPGMELTVIVCRNEAARHWAENLKGEACIYENAEELFAHPSEYDAVLIVTPHKTHPVLAAKAFSLGKHVFCDKPAGISALDAADMSEAARQSGKIYAMMFHQRLYPEYIRIRQLLQQQELGTIHRAMLVNSRYFRTAFYHQSGSWRSSWLGEGGGALINQGQHLLDIWTWLFGMPKTVYAAIPFGKYNDFQVDDEATITMKYPNQMTGVFMLTTGEAVNQERLEIVGSKGKILLEDGTLHIWKYSEDACEYAKTAKVNSRDDLTIHQTVEIFEKQPEPYVQMLQNFAEAVKQGKPLVAPGEEGSHALELTNAAYLSAWKRRIVQLPMDLKEYQEELNLQIKKEGEGKHPQSAH